MVLLRLLEGAVLSEARDGAMAVATPSCTLHLHAPDVVGEALSKLSGAGTPRDALFGHVGSGGDLTQLAHLAFALDSLEREGLLTREIRTADGKSYATVTPRAPRFETADDEEIGTGRVRLSPYAYLRRGADTLLLESPLSSVRFALHAVAAAEVVHQLAASGVEATEHGGDTGDVDPAGSELLHLLRSSGMLEAGPRDPVDGWAFHDLLFHAASRGGRDRAPYGARDVKKEQPAPIERPPSLHRIALAEPDVARARRDFGEVLRTRRSIRGHADDPITLEELGLLLHDAVRPRLDRPMTTTWGDVPTRPYPAGGAGYELELYPLLARCAGAPAGLYHYDSLSHELHQLRAIDDDLRTFLRSADAAWGGRGEPHVLILISARFDVLSRRYSSMAYAAILKNLGALYQTLYMVATALDLAPCALGGGDAQAFARVTGLDYLIEGSVGEFAIGRPPLTSNPPMPPAG